MLLHRDPLLGRELELGLILRPVLVGIAPQMTVLHLASHPVRGNIRRERRLQQPALLMPLHLGIEVDTPGIRVKIHILRELRALPDRVSPAQLNEKLTGGNHLRPRCRCLRRQSVLLGALQLPVRIDIPGLPENRHILRTDKLVERTPALHELGAALPVDQ